MNKRCVAIALGSNKGNRLMMLRCALEMLTKSGFSVQSTSRVWETAPWGVEQQPRFLNMCVLLESDLPAEEILRALKQVEFTLGRKKTVRWGPREIDLDILLIDDEVIDSDDLTVPHPHMHERAFVLVPLAEIAHDMVHPKLKKSIGQLSMKVSDADMDWITRI